MHACMWITCGKNAAMCVFQELDMNSCFVTNAAAIAKRKLEQKPKSDKKDKKTENFRKHVAEKKDIVEPHIKVWKKMLKWQWSGVEFYYI